jgi:DUF3040 family protein
VVTVLEPNEKFLFDDMVTRLRADDPAFVRSIDKLTHPRRRMRVALAILLWTLMPICIVYGGWTGLIMAVVAGAYGARLMTKRTGLGESADAFSWWSSSRKRPGASL